MSQSDSFIDEVTDELRRDRLFAAFKRWAWVGVALVVLIVGGAAVREWRASDARAEAEARGDALLAAFEAGDAEAVASVAAEGPVEGVVALLAAAVPDADPEGALARLEAVAAAPEVPARYRDLAVLKAVILAPEAPIEERRERLQAIAGAGAPYRVLAQEQLALLAVEAGDAEAALAQLRALLEDADATEGLRERVGQLIVALGGSLDAA